MAARGLMGCVVPPPPRLNVDRHGNPRDYATYARLRYRKHVVDESPERIAFLHGPRRDGLPVLGQQVCRK